MQAAAAPIAKQVENFGMPWEKAYGYGQAIKVGNVVYLSGQLSHDDEGRLIGPAPVDAAGRILDAANMELQMRTTTRLAFPEQLIEISFTVVLSSQE